MSHRREDVLRAIVRDYVTTGEPVGSKALVEHHDLGVSPATIRNDMAALEKDGYIYQPHTSAGRIPTDKGYRAFVDQIATIKPLSLGERRAIELFLGEAVTLDDVVDRTVRLLTRLTHQVAVVQYPTFQRSHLRHLELLGIGHARAMLVVIAEPGRVEQRVIDTVTPLSDTELLRLRGILNQELSGMDMNEAVRSLRTLAEAQPERMQPAIGAVEQALLDTLAPEVSQRIVMSGTANLLRAKPDAAAAIAPVLDALEEQVALLRLFSEAGAENLAVSIGVENQHDALNDVAVVTGSYGVDDEVYAHLGVIGPKRMDYPAAMASVRTVARYLSRFLQAGRGQ